MQTRPYAAAAVGYRHRAAAEAVGVVHVDVAGIRKRCAARICVGAVDFDRTEAGIRNRSVLDCRVYLHPARLRGIVLRGGLCERPVRSADVEYEVVRRRRAAERNMCARAVLRHICRDVAAEGQRLSAGAVGLERQRIVSGIRDGESVGQRQVVCKGDRLRSRERQVAAEHAVYDTADPVVRIVIDIGSRTRLLPARRRIRERRARNDRGNHGNCQSLHVPAPFVGKGEDRLCNRPPQI